MTKKILQLLFTCVSLSAVTAYAGFQVSGTQLLDANDQPFVMRGINHAHTWYAHTTAKAIPDIAATGANTVRVVLSNGTHGEGWQKTPQHEVAEIISLCKAERLVCMLEVHDTTGYGEKQGATTVALAADYFVEMAELLRGEEDYVLINIANEPFGNGAEGQWVDAHIDAIQTLRNADLNHTLVVDAPNWGQDYTHTMLNNASQVFNSDPNANVLFSVHMYQVYRERAAIDHYMSTFLSNNLALVIGEFGFKHGDGPENDVDEDSILELTKRYGIGYLGWSWSGNSGGVEYLDLTHNFDSGNLTEWGERLINGVDGIRATSEPASVYSGVVGGSSSSSSASSSSSSASSSASSSSASSSAASSSASSGASGGAGGGVSAFELFILGALALFGWRGRRHLRA